MQELTLMLIRFAYLALLFFGALVAARMSDVSSGTALSVGGGARNPRQRILFHGQSDLLTGSTRDSIDVRPDHFGGRDSAQSAADVVPYLFSQPVSREMPSRKRPRSSSTVSSTQVRTTTKI